MHVIFAHCGTNKGEFMNLLERLQNEVAQTVIEYNHYKNGKRVAGMRTRKCLQTIKKIAQELRIEIQTERNRLKKGAQL